MVLDCILAEYCDLLMFTGLTSQLASAKKQCDKEATARMTLEEEVVVLRMQVDRANTAVSQKNERVRHPHAAVFLHSSTLFLFFGVVAAA